MRDQVQLSFDSSIMNHSSTRLKNNYNDIILDVSEESSSSDDIPEIVSSKQNVETQRNIADDNFRKNEENVMNTQGEENGSLPKNLFWIPDVTQSQIAWQNRILDSMVKIAPDWDCYIKKGRFHQILGRHSAANWTKIVLGIIIEIYGNENSKYMSAKGTRNTIGINRNLRCAILDLLLSMEVDTTQEQLTTVINKFCSIEKQQKDRTQMWKAVIKCHVQKKHAPSKTIMEHGGPPITQPVVYDGPSQLSQIGGQSSGNNFPINESYIHYSIPHAIALSTNI
ncbi:hypothetical protein PV326_010637 [Microctonus aethiopoides]|nr:hypothetical protein PV326_010637 [Microctonus aethiopoides]